MAEVEELRVQPQDILAEQSVLGAIFIDESKLVFVREYIDSRDFFKYAHRLIFKPWLICQIEAKPLMQRLFVRY